MSLNYRCPICQSPLMLKANTLSCENNHSFDFAKEGYVNLLPVQNKKSKQPGDSLEMVQARRSFLEQGYYGFLQSALANMVKSLNANIVIDLGCGEGFYTHAIADHSQATVYGVDISKSAVKYAAKRYKQCHFSVASISQAPFNGQLADVLVSVFAPLFDSELNRLVTENGSLIVASPGPTHLNELKQYIYHTVNEHTEVVTPVGFAQTSQQLISEHVSLSFNDVRNLIMMTPFAWKFRPEHWQELEQQSQHSVTLSFYVTQFTKTAL